MPLRIVAILLAGLAYILGTHWLMTRPGGSPWNVVGVLTPMLAALAIGAWRSGQRVVGGLICVGIVALIVQALRGVAMQTELLYLAQHVGIHTALAIGFGSTLRAGHTPLITTLAGRVHKNFTAARLLYTRHVTIAWVVYFIAMALISLALFAFASFEAWAVFANLLTPASLVAMFVGEYLLRYRLHPEFERSSLADAIRSYRAGDKTA